MIVLRFPALPLYTRGRTIDKQTVLIALNCMVACLAHVSFSFIFSLLRKTLRVTISFQLNIRLCLCVH